MESKASELFKNKLLWRVYLAWFLKRILPLILIEVIVVIVALKVLADTVFVAKVFENAALAGHDSLWGFATYLVSSFFGTRFVVQISILLGLGLGALILRDAIRAILTYFSTLRGRRGGVTNQ